jgi:hypothetical protein
MTRIARTIAATLVACSVLATGLVPAGAAAPWEAPRIQRVIGGPSRPGVAAWGLAYNPVTGEMIVGDYVSNQVRRFALSGRWLGDFSNPKGNVGGVGSALAVDPRDGSTYLAVTGDGKTSKDVRKYDASGTSCTTSTSPARSRGSRSTPRGTCGRRRPSGGPGSRSGA